MVEKFKLYVTQKESNGEEVTLLPFITKSGPPDVAEFSQKRREVKGVEEEGVEVGYQ